MSVLLGLSFAALGCIAILAMAATLRRYGPLIAELRSALQEPSPIEEVRLKVREHGLLPAQANRGLLRHLHRPKPIMHRLHGRAPRRAAA
jgi:hypothetical protein